MISTSVPFLEVEIIGLFAGTPQSCWPDKPASAIDKSPVTGWVEINETGLLNDQQADLRVHGGAEKAIHHYAADHLDFWKAAFPDDATKFRSGGFGENISTTGLTEHQICLGDIFSLGTARVEICQGRQPCWKLNAHTNIPFMAVEFQKSGKTGWYYRVIENGKVQTGDKMRLLARPNPRWQLSDVIAARFNSGLDADIAAEIASLPALSESWRTSFIRKASKQGPEDTSLRLSGNFKT